MNLNIIDYVNEAPPSNSIGPIHSFLKEIDLAAPVDTYVEHSASLRELGDKEALSRNPHLGGLLLLGTISAAEAYFRSTLSLTLEICPICREVAADKQINLGGVLWHGHSEFRRSAFEHLSFSSRSELVNAARKYLNFEMRDSRFQQPLTEFDIACHLRHGIVHNGGVLPGRNAVQIGAKRFKKPVRISVDFALLQRSIAAIDTLVLTFNRELFNELCKRWAVDWRRRPDWNLTEEKESFGKIWKAFFSKKLHKNRRGKTHISRAKCLHEVKQTYNIL